jgi:hypothetical protein
MLNSAVRRSRRVQMGSASTGGFRQDERLPPVQAARPGGADIWPERRRGGRVRRADVPVGASPRIGRAVAFATASFIRTGYERSLAIDTRTPPNCAPARQACLGAACDRSGSPLASSSRNGIPGLHMRAPRGVPAWGAGPADRLIHAREAAVRESLDDASAPFRLVARIMRQALYPFA